MRFSASERAVEGCPFDASTAREVCEVVLPGGGSSAIFSDIGFKQIDRADMPGLLC
jgi:hypothetical protein